MTALHHTVFLELCQRLNSERTCYVEHALAAARRCAMPYHSPISQCSDVVVRFAVASGRLRAKGILSTQVQRLLQEVEAKGKQALLDATSFPQLRICPTGAATPLSGLILVPTKDSAAQHSFLQVVYA